jgi:hypothetical protein
MGMTLDKAIEHGKEQLEIFGGEHKEFIECAIETMRKYKKVEEIVKEWRENGLDYDSCDAMENIERVINNGKID